MTLFQLKQAIEYNKARIMQMERIINGPDPGDQTRAKTNFINYRSALKVCEFTLQRRIDEMTHHNGKSMSPILMNKQRLNKQYRKDFERLISSRWDESQWLSFEKVIRNFIQNYNEL